MPSGCLFGLRLRGFCFFFDELIFFKKKKIKIYLIRVVSGWVG
jgi:hypothetical protein